MLNGQAMCPDKFELMAYFDGEASPENAAYLAEHISQCTSCASTIQQWRAIGSLITALPLREPTADALHRLSRHAAALPSLELRRAGLILSNVAAAILLVGCALWYHSQQAAVGPVSAAPNSSWEMTAVSVCSQLDDSDRTKIADWMTVGLESPRR